MPPIYVFGAFRLDPSRRLLFHGSEVIPLPERLAQLLLLLIQANGSVVDRETIAARVWPDGPLTDGNLSQHMYMLRQLLDERARDRSYVLTVRGRGYRFAAPVSVQTTSEPIAEPNKSPGEILLRSGIEAFYHYGRGCYLVERQNARAFTDAVEHFEAALRIDPEYVPALVGVARAYALLAEYWYAPGSYAFPKAKRAIVRALELDSSSASAHAVLSNVLLFCDWKWTEARRELDIAIGLNPSSTFVRSTAAWFHVCRGSDEQVFAEVQKALALEPSSPALQLLLARAFLHSGAYSAAIASLSNLIEGGPAFSLARRHRAQAYILNGQPAEALGDLLLMPQDRSEDVALRLPLLARAYADCGDVERAQEVYASLLDMAHTEFVVGWNLAIAAVGLGRFDEALDHLERALERREPALLMIRTLPWFEPIAKRARFKQIRAALGV